MNKKKKTFRYGGQAVMEGVMMRGKNSYALSVRHTSGEIKTKHERLKPPNTGWKALPIIRGVINFASSMSLGFDMIDASFDMAGFEDIEEEPSKFEKWIEKKLGNKTTDVIMGFSMILGVLLALGLFVFIPVTITSFFKNLSPWAVSAVEGLIRLAIFMGYLILMSKNDDISRVLGYHGAEHKTIHAYEKGLDLTVENIKPQSRLHKRCGTSFIFLVMLVSMIFFSFIHVRDVWLRLLVKVLLIPFVAGISYEVLQFASQSELFIVKAISYPGLMFQKLTTKEPDASQIEVAITSLERVLMEDGVITNEERNSESSELVTE